MKNFDNLINKIFINVIPSEEEIKIMNGLIEDIVNKDYKKIIFYSFGTNNQIIRLIQQFYSANSYSFHLEVICSYDSQTINYLSNSVKEDNLIIFLSRSGNTFEVVHALDIVLGKALSISLLENIIVFTNEQENNKIMIPIQKYKIKKYNIRKGICGRFECTNSITLFLIKLFNSKIDLLELCAKLNKTSFFLDLEKADKDFFRNFSLANPLILYSSNSRLNGLLRWIQHLWYETFGNTLINLHCEDYSSLFHCSIQHYFSHKDKNYNFVHLYTQTESIKYMEENFLSKLNKTNSINIFVDAEKDNALIITMSRIVVSILHIMRHNKINHFGQEHVDNYKLNNSYFNKVIFSEI